MTLPNEEDDMQPRQSLKLLVLRYVLVGVLATTSLISTQVYADPPTTKRLIGTLVTPATAWAYYGTATTHTNGLASTAARPPEIKALARALSRDGALTGDAFAQRVEDYVRRNIEVEFRFGLGKGARGAAIDQSGTAFDQAELMVEILREKGQMASYQLGTITLNADQFGKWTGLITGLDQGTQTFTVNARAACQMVADGGIPATVNGASTCSGLSGALATITLGHVWVSANGKTYDPAMKTHLLKTGIDLAVQMGCGSDAAPTCATQADNSLFLEASSGSQNSVNYVSNLNESSLKQYINQRAISLQNFLEATDRNLSIDDTVGKKSIKMTEQTSTSNFARDANYTWSNDIPDQFRTAFLLRYNTAMASLFSDEISGKRLLGTFKSPPDGSSATSIIWLDGIAIATQTVVGTFGFDDMIISINQPFSAAASGAIGTLGDRTLRLRGISRTFHPNKAQAFRDSVNSFWIILNQGKTGIGASNFSALQSKDNALYAIGQHLGGDDIVPPLLQSSGGVQIAELLAQGSQVTKLISGISKTNVETHDNLGILFPFDRVTPEQAYFNLSSQLSCSSNSASAADEKAACGNLTMALSALEGSTLQQATDSMISSSAVSLFSLANQKNLRFYDANSVNINNVLSNISLYSTERRRILNQYAASGYNIILTQLGEIGNTTIAGGSLNVKVSPSLIFKSLEEGSLVNEVYKGGGAPGGTEAVEGILKTVSNRDYALKSSNLVGVNLATGTFSLLPIDGISTGVASDDSLTVSRVYSSSSHNLKRCSPRYAGGARTGIPNLRSTCVREEENFDQLQGGGSHSLQWSASLGSNGLEGLGRTSAVRASFALASLRILADLRKSDAFRSQLTAIFTSFLAVDSLNLNSISISRPPDGMEFVRLASGRWDAPPEVGGAKINLSGNPGSYFVANGSTAQRSYQATSIDFFDGDGGQVKFVPGKAICVNRSLAPVDGSVTCPYRPYYRVSQFTKTNGLQQNWNFFETPKFNQQAFSVEAIQFVLKDVSNSVGRKITFGFSNMQNLDLGVTPTYPASNITIQNPNTLQPFPTNYTFVGDGGVISSINVDANRSITFSTAGGCASPRSVLPLSGGVDNWYSGGCFSDSTTLPDLGVIKYQFSLATANDPAGSLVRPSLLTQVYLASNNLAPAVKIFYDSVGHVAETIDLANKRRTHFVAVVANEAYRIGETKDSRGAITSTVFDENGLALRVTDPNGRITLNAYDSARRLIRTVFPEGNASEYTYDLRGNRTRECMIPKGVVTWSLLTAHNLQWPKCNTSRSPLADLATTTTYVEAANLRADQCVNMKTCNKPSFTIDPKGNRTDYTWSGVHGQLLTEMMSADASGVRPVITYDYGTFTGVDNATFYLLTSKQETISSGVTTTTTYEYDTANKFVLKSSVVDSGGLALRTCYRFDATGNLISKSDPKAGLSVCP